MAVSMASLRRGGEIKPNRVMLYGTHGVGKTSLAAAAPAPVFLQTEDGLATIPADTFGLLRTYGDVVDAIATLANEPHDFKTVVVDSLDWLEPVVWTEACRANGWANIETPGYGKGYVAALDTWRLLLDGLSVLRDERGMGVILLAHAEVKKFEPPESEPYDRYQPKLNAKTSALIQEHVDDVLFVNYRVSLIKDNPKEKNSRVRGVGGGQRVLYTQERPSHLAKNRWRMPETIILPDEPEKMWSAVAEHLPFYKTSTRKAA